MTGPMNTEGEWGWHRVGPGASAGRLYSLNHGDGIGWLLGSRRQLTRACLLNEAAGRGVEQKVFSPTDESVHLPAPRRISARLSWTCARTESR